MKPIYASYRHHRMAHSCGEIALVEVNRVNEELPTVVYVHGWLDNAASFFSVMSSLFHYLPHAHQVAFDLPGHGLSSSKSSDNFYPFHDYIDDLHQILVNLSLKNCILVGHSLGGLISSCYSAAFPESVVGLIQIDGIGPLGESSENAVQRLRSGVISRGRIRKKPAKGYTSYAQALAHKAKTTKLAERLVGDLVERGIEELDGVWRWRADRALSSQALYRMPLEQVNVYLQQVTCPFDIIVAQHGLIIERQDLQRWRPEHSVVHHFGGGHHCHIEYPQALAEIIVSQWNQLNEDNQRR
jgi:pimeloyl-ACP methyl ester carboxylesterase